MFHNVSVDNLWICCKKGSPILPPGADHGQRFLEKIQNGGRRRSFNNFISSLHFFGFNWGQSYLATLVTPQNCTKMLTFVVQFAYFSIRPKKGFVFTSNFWATFDGFLSNFWETFWEIAGNLLENLEQLVESLNKIRDLK